MHIFLENEIFNAFNINQLLTDMTAETLIKLKYNDTYNELSLDKRP